VVDALFAGANLRVADAAVLGKCTEPAHWHYPNSLCVTFEKQAVPCVNSQYPPDLAWHRDLPFACDLGLLSHDPYFTTTSLPLKHVVNSTVTTTAYELSL
jgi:hypothetical protein